MLDEETISVLVGVSAVVDISVTGDLEHLIEGESVGVGCVILEAGAIFPQNGKIADKKAI